MNGWLLNPRWWGGAVLACFVAALAALAMPVPMPEGGGEADPSNILPEGPVEVVPEALDGFLAIRRWESSSSQEIREAEAVKAVPAEPAEPSIDATLAKMGFVGLIVTKERSAVLLKSPEGRIARFASGDKLPDGRTLVSVTDNSLTLGGGDLPEEVLTLFPRIRTEPFADDGGDDISGSESMRRSDSE